MPHAYRCHPARQAGSISWNALAAAMLQTSADPAVPKELVRVPEH